MGNKLSALAQQGETAPTKKRPSVIFNQKKHERKKTTTSGLSSQNSDPNKDTISGKSFETSSSTVEPPTLSGMPGEDDRMNATQFFIKALFGGNTMEVINEGIDFNSSSVKVLDIGCGSGSWVMDMATDYPNPEFVGIDCIALFPSDIRPPNVTFIKHDALKGLPFEDNSIDLVQLRLFTLTFSKTEWDFALKEAYRVTKPGGYIQILEAVLVDKGDELITTFADKVCTLMIENNQDHEVCRRLPQIINSAGYDNVADTKKTMLFEGHPLSKECLYIVYLTITACQGYVKHLYDITTEAEFDEWRNRYIESRRSSTVSDWFCAVGRKPTA